MRNDVRRRQVRVRGTCRRAARRRLTAVELRHAWWWVDVRVRLQGPPPADPAAILEPQAYAGAPVPSDVLHPGGRDPTIWCRYGTALLRSVIVRDTPETRTPAWWRARVNGPFHLTLHPYGLATHAGLRATIDLGTWSARDRLPETPVGEAPAEIIIVGPRARVRGTRTAGDPAAPVYVVGAAAWEAAASAKQARLPPRVRVHLVGGRTIEVDTAGTGTDAMPVYVQKP